jgi:uncharacterized protein
MARTPQFSPTVSPLRPVSATHASGGVVAHRKPSRNPVASSVRLRVVQIDHVITSEAELRAVIGHPTPLVCQKLSDRLNDLTRQFVEAAPFVCLATSTPAGDCDVSPRGDTAGFVRILDERTLLVPERPGNKLADTLVNLLSNPHIGMLFLVPGVTDTFRVNGTAVITSDAELLAPSTYNDKAPKLGIVVTIDEAYTQCSKAFIRSNLWNPTTFRNNTEFPTGGQIMALLTGTVDPTTYDTERTARYTRQENFW